MVSPVYERHLIIFYHAFFAALFLWLSRIPIVKWAWVGGSVALHCDRVAGVISLHSVAPE
jgi:hypothetical protein